jgi:spore coat polysaccharide biosynthesis protein SpsF
MKHKVIILVAVRLKSTRLPMKALKVLYGEPLIVRLVERVGQAKIPSNIILCTSTNTQDDALEELANKYGITCFRGSELDVMSRFIEVIDKEKASIIVRVTGDNPLTDPVMMDFMLAKHIENDSEYTYTDDLPVGTRSEIICANMLKKCYKLLQDPNSSEYMTWMLNRPDHFKVLHVPAPVGAINRPEILLTVDTEDDFNVVHEIYKKFNGNPPKLQDIISWIDLNSGMFNNNNNNNNNDDAQVNCKFVLDEY